MTGAPAIRPAEPLSPADWLTLWQTVCFDLPLAFSGQAGALADGTHAPSPAAGDRNGPQARNRPADTQARAWNRSGADFASEFLEELEGCFA